MAWKEKKTYKEELIASLHSCNNKPLACHLAPLYASVACVDLKIASAGCYILPDINHFNVKGYQNKWMKSEAWIKGGREGMAGVSEYFFFSNEKIGYCWKPSTSGSA